MDDMLRLYSAFEWFVKDHQNGGHADSCGPDLPEGCHCGFSNLQTVIKQLTDPSIALLELSQQAQELGLYPKG